MSPLSFLEIGYNNKYILLLSKTILIVPSLSVALSPFVIISWYILDIWILPMRTFQILIAGHAAGFTRYVTQAFSCMIDILCAAWGYFLGLTYGTNFSAIIHLFMTDAIGKFQL